MINNNQNSFYFVDFELYCNKFKLYGFTIWDEAKVTEFNFLVKLIGKSGLKFFRFYNYERELEVPFEKLFAAYKIKKIGIDKAQCITDVLPLTKDYYYGFMILPEQLENALLGKTNESPI